MNAHKHTYTVSKPRNDARTKYDLGPQSSIKLDKYGTAPLDVSNFTASRV